MMSTICFIHFVIMDSVSKNMLSCLPKCLVTFITVSSTTTIVPVNYSKNPKPLTAFIAISPNHGLPDISVVSRLSYIQEICNSQLISPIVHHHYCFNGSQFSTYPTAATHLNHSCLNSNTCQNYY